MNQPPPLPVQQDNSLLIPNGYELPPICVVTGKENVPLVKVLWTQKIFWWRVAHFSYYLTPEAKACRDNVKPRSTKCFWLTIALGGVHLAGLAGLFMTGKDRFIGAFSIVMLAAFGLVGFRVARLDRKTRCIAARHVWFSRQIELRDLLPEVRCKLADDTFTTAGVARPGDITFICVLGFTYVTTIMPLILTDEARNRGAWYPPCLAISAMVGIAGIVGLWHLRRWAFLAFTGFVALRLMVSWAMVGWSVSSLLSFGIAIALLFKHWSKALP